jgi:prolyl oligopeptidase
LPINCNTRVRLGGVVDEYHGIRIADPYRWLEDPDTPESRQWIAAENNLTRSYLSTLPNLDAIKARLTVLWSPVTYPAKSPLREAGLVNKGDRYFFLRRDPGKNQPILYWMESRHANPKPLLDPNTLSAEGTAALSSWTLSTVADRRMPSAFTNLKCSPCNQCEHLCDQWKS